MSFAEAANEFPLILRIAVFAIGACVGSFINVCVFRIQKGQSITYPPSHCECGKPIKFYDNIPILSWFILKGKARCCGCRISFRHPFVETLTALVFLALWLNFEPAQAACYMVFASILIFCTFYDIDTMTIPDAATIGGTVCAVVASAIVPELHDARMADLPAFASHLKGFGLSVFSAAAAAGFLYWVRLLAEKALKREAMGEGDVILLGFIGAFCGWKGAIFALFAGSIIGCAVMLPLVFWECLKPKKSGGLGLEIPFGPWLAAGAIVYVFTSRWVLPIIDSFLLLFAK